jgi:phosphoribosyl-ATP pyrophosphohydrolase
MLIIIGILLLCLGFVSGAWWHSITDEKYIQRRVIELKNIPLEGITQAEQIQKIYEEVDEFVQAVIKGDVTNAIEELFDVVQASLGALQKMGLSAEYVMSQYPKHLEKIRFRPRQK